MYFLIAWVAAWFVVGIFAAVNEDFWYGASLFGAGGILGGLLVVIIVFAVTVLIPISSYKLVYDEKVFYGKDSGQNDQHLELVNVIGADINRPQLLVVGVKDPTFGVAEVKLNSISYSSDNEFYIEEITRHLDSGWFHFPFTNHQYDLVLPMNMKATVTQ